jgi:hypothetical protein
MASELHTACGQITTALSKSALALALTSNGIASEAAVFVVRCRIGTEGLEWEPIEDGYLLSGHSDAGHSNLQRMSEVLASLRLKHRIELYADDDALIGYLHYDWPLKD